VKGQFALNCRLCNDFYRNIELKEEILRGQPARTIESCEEACIEITAAVKRAMLNAQFAQDLRQPPRARKQTTMMVFGALLLFESTDRGYITSRFYRAGKSERKYIHTSGMHRGRMKPSPGDSTFFI
jgi:hypothetical protein